MKRIDGLFEQVVSFSNLLAAWRKARRGKRSRTSVDRFTFRLEPELLRLQRELMDGTWLPGPFTQFTIDDPKPRLISAAPFADRVVHHAIMDVLEPWFERCFDPDSFACRQARGVDAALHRAVQLSRRAAWVLRSDIARCFPSMTHDVVLAALRERVADERLCSLIERIVRHGGQDDRGLPIGNLTSQWLANLVLDGLDRLVRHELRPLGYLRYMDDFALFLPDREALRWAQRRLDTLVRERLDLRLNERVTHSYATADGWPFLGFTVRPGGLGVRAATVRRFRRRLSRLHHEHRMGRLTATDVQARTGCMVAHLKRGQSLALRRSILRPAEL